MKSIPVANAVRTSIPSLSTCNKLSHVLNKRVCKATLSNALFHVASNPCSQQLRHKYTAGAIENTEAVTPPTQQQLLVHFRKEAVPMIGFGFMVSCIVRLFVTFQSSRVSRVRR